MPESFPADEACMGAAVALEATARFVATLVRLRTESVAVEFGLPLGRVDVLFLRAVWKELYPGAEPSIAATSLPEDVALQEPPPEIRAPSSETPTPEPFLKTDEVAAIFGVTTATVKRWLKDGWLPGFRTPGGRVLFERTVVEDAQLRVKNNST